MRQPATRSYSSLHHYYCLIPTNSAGHCHHGVRRPDFRWVVICAGPRSRQRPMNWTKTRGGTEKGSELMGESRATDEIAFRVLAMRRGRRGLSLLIEGIAFLRSMPAPRSAGSMEPPEVSQKSGIRRMDRERPCLGLRLWV